MRNGRLTALANKLLEKYNREIVVKQQKNTEKRKQWLRQFLFKQPDEILEEILLVEDESKSQHKQDLFALAELKFKKNGFFVEFGATNGITLSNTFILEKKYNWEGILSEPAKGWIKQLKKNRNCNIESDCVWKKTGVKLDFLESSIGVISTISSYADVASNKAGKQKKYKVNTISLSDLLKKHNAPRTIDYLSIDTEGSEYEILKEFDFSQYDIKVITVEYNEKREELFNLLTKQNFVRKFVEVSECDDWYVKNTN